ncbi:nucleotidyltransferase [Candidatus Aerophobetes bacterium]|uniref:Nucleotidyltransferase n=1 Tax=Aerophobetes bacterium TaxID=2030807 RepID=A0A523S3P9_UNCAE|nr:MAG: nucleotidyltransferase [Candidatus Aerophobetes bacterium]
MNVLEEIKEILKKYKEDIVREYKIKEIGIFGSYVRGEQKKRSDIDILVEFNEDDIPDLLRFIEMERYLKRLLRRKVDLVRKEGIRPELKAIVLKEVIYL